MDAEGRSKEIIAADDLRLLAEIATCDRAERFERRPRWARYEDRILCVALCQGAALHYVDHRNGVKDFDVYTFYAEEPSIGMFPPRWLLNADFGPSKFGRHPEDPPTFKGRRVDLIGRSLKVDPTADPVEAVRDYLQSGPTETARRLAAKAVVAVAPEPLCGTVIWPAT